MNPPRTALLVALLLLPKLGLSGPALAQEPALSFDQVIELALQGPSVRLAELQLEQTREELTALSGFLSVNASTGYRRSLREESHSFDPVTINATLHIVPYGPGFDAEVQAGQRLIQAELALRDARADVVVGATQRYATALRNSQEVTLAAAELAYARAVLEATSEQVDAGAAGPAQQLGAELTVREAEHRLSSASRALTGALEALGNLLGLEVPAVLGEPPTATLPVGTDLQARTGLRSDVLNAELSFAQAERSVAGAIRDALPSGSLNLSYSSTENGQNLRLGAGFDTRSFQPSLGLSFDPDVPGADGSSFSLEVSIQMTLDTGTPAALQAANLAVAAARHRLEQVRSAAGLDIAERRRALADAEAALRLSQSRLELRQLDLEAAATRRELGLVGPLELTRAELDLEAARLASSRARDSLIVSLLRYAQSLALDPLEVLP